MMMMPLRGAGDIDRNSSFRHQAPERRLSPDDAQTTDTLALSGVSALSAHPFRWWPVLRLGSSPGAARGLPGLAQHRRPGRQAIDCPSPVPTDNAGKAAKSSQCKLLFVVAADLAARNYNLSCPWRVDDGAAGGRGGRATARLAHMPDLWHLTIRTGHMRLSPRSEVADHVVSGLQVIIARGGGAVGNTGWAVLIIERSPDGAIFDLSHRGVEVARCFLAITSALERRLWGEAV